MAVQSIEGTEAVGGTITYDELDAAKAAGFDATLYIAARTSGTTHKEVLAGGVNMTIPGHARARRIATHDDDAKRLGIVRRWRDKRLHRPRRQGLEDPWRQEAVLKAPILWTLPSISGDVPARPASVKETSRIARMLAQSVIDRVQATRAAE